MLLGCRPDGRRVFVILSPLVTAALMAGCLSSDLGDGVGPPGEEDAACFDQLQIHGGTGVDSWWASQDRLGGTIEVVLTAAPAEGEIVLVWVNLRPNEGTSREKMENQTLVFLYQVLSIDGRTFAFRDEFHSLNDLQQSEPIAFPHAIKIPVNATHDVGLNVLSRESASALKVKSDNVVQRECTLYDADRKGDDGFSEARQLSVPGPIEHRITMRPDLVRYWMVTCAVRMGEPVTPLGETLSIVPEDSPISFGGRTYGARAGQPVPYGFCYVEKGGAVEEINVTISFEGEAVDADIHWAWAYATTGTCIEVDDECLRR